MVGGPSNAGGMFCDWVGRAGRRGAGGATAQPQSVPVWAPYPRGERVAAATTRPARGARPARPHARRRRGAPCRVRGVGLRRATRDRRDARRDRRAAGADRRVRAAASASTSGSRRSPTSPGCRSTASRCPRARRSARRGSHAWRPASRSRPRCRTRAAGRASGGRSSREPSWLEPVAERYERFRWLSDTITCSRRSADDLTRVDEVHVARAERVAVGVAHHAPVRRDGPSSSAAALASRCRCEGGGRQFPQVVARRDDDHVDASRSVPALTGGSAATSASDPSTGGAASAGWRCLGGQRLEASPAPHVDAHLGARHGVARRRTLRPTAR